MWKRVMIASVTGTTVDNSWTTESLRAPSFTPGVGAIAMPPATRTDPTGKKVYEGAQLLALLRFHHVIILQHAPPPGWISFLRDSKDSQIEKVLLWIDFESTVAAGYWSPLQKPLETVQRTYTLRSPFGNNRFGNRLVDPYEGYGNLSDPNDWAVRESKHAWIMDVEPPRYTEMFAQVLGELVYSYSSHGGVGVFTDNCNTWQYQGTATNVTQNWMLERGPAFIVGMQTYMSLLRKLNISPIYGNCAAVTKVYPQLDAKMAELDLVDVSNPLVLRDMVSSSIVNGTTERRGLPQMYFAHCEPRGQGPRWAQMQSLWDAFATALDNTFDDDMGIVTARTSRYLMCPTQCEGKK